MDIDYDEFFLEIMLTKLFNIYDSTRILSKTRKIHHIEADYIFKNIDCHAKTTGIMIGDLSITEDYSIFLFVLDYTVFIINEADLKTFKSFYSKNKEKIVFFFFDTKCKENFEKNEIKEKAIEINQKYLSQKLQRKISECIIKKSQIRTLNRHYESMLIINQEKSQFNYKDFIHISSFLGSNRVHLRFNIYDEFLYILKCFNSKDEDSKKRFEHEISFYQNHNFNQPFICKYYGQTQNNDDLYIIIEYIEGQTLKDFISNKIDELDKDQKMKIIMNIMCALEYLHLNDFIYRDLKTNNIIIDPKLNAILIDFDQLRKFDGEPMTQNIGSFLFVSPEQSSSADYSFKTDIFSLGKIINLILSFDKRCSSEYNELYNKYKYCVEKSPELRPNISNLLNNFFNIIQESENFKPYLKEVFYIRNNLFDFLIKSEIKKDEIYELYAFIGLNYYEGEFISRDINKAIKYLELSSNHNISNAQYYLGVIYYEDECISRDINKAIHYLTLSSDQNNSEAQYSLGMIYYKGEFISRNINKAINYLTLSSDQNDSEAQYILGEIYYKGEFVSRDINKAIHYLTLSSDQNNSEAQYILGEIYYKGEFISRDINKAIYYFTQSSNQNNSDAQMYLFDIFFMSNINKSIHYLKLSADQQNPLAQCILGIFYYKGEHVSFDINKAIQYLTLASNQNHSEAQFNLFEIYFLGKYVKRDINKAIHYLELASSQNNSMAQYFLGYIIYKGIYKAYDIKTAIYILELSSKQNNQLAQNCLGEIYYEGKYIQRNVDKAIYYFSLSAKQNNSDAQFQLGLIYYSCNNIPHDIDKAIYYLKLSANQNNLRAQGFLGIVYYDNTHSHFNIKNAIYYLTLAANRNESFSQYFLGTIYLYNDQVPINIEKAIYYFTRSADQNNSYAQYNLGRIYFEGQFIKQDINKAIYYLTISSKNNNSHAQYLLGLIYYNDEYVPRNINKAILYFTLSSNQLNPDAQFYLGQIYYDGIYVPRNINKAIHYFKESSSLNNGFSKNNLGVIYKNGDGVEKNIYHAIEYFEEAISKTNDLFSMFNLARIYYFGIGVHPDIKKSVELFEKLPKDVFYVDIFLRFIKHDHDKYDGNEIKNIKCINKVKAECITNEDFLNKIKIEGDLLSQIFKDTDMIYTSNLKFFDHDNDTKSFFKNSLNLNNYPKNINKDFYDGFYND